MMIDDAHSSGVLGRNGRGTVDHFNLHGRVDIQVGTLSKAVGVLGGYVCGTPRPDRVSVPSRAAVPVLHIASARRGRRPAWPPSTFSRTSRNASRRCGSNTRYFKEALQQRRLRHGRQRDAHHAHHGGRGEDGARIFTRGCSRTACWPPASAFPPCPKARRASEPSSPRRTRANCSTAPAETLSRVAREMGILTASAAR